MSDRPKTRTLIEALGLGAVILSLVFVAYELRQNTAATRSATQQAIYEGGVESNLNVMNNELLREMLVMTRDSLEWVEVAPRDADFLLVERFYLNRFNNIENAYYHFLEGTLDERLWAAHAGWLRLVADDHRMRYFWGEFRAAYFEDFQTYVDSALGISRSGSAP
jgi:hypothetical protein